jgi:hypothetical protein
VFVRRNYSKPTLIRLHLIRTEIWKVDSVHSWAHTLKDTWDLGARGLSECVEGSWRDWHHARKHPRWAWARWRRPWISASDRGRNLLEWYILIKSKYKYWCSLHPFSDGGNRLARLVHVRLVFFWDVQHIFRNVALYILFGVQGHALYVDKHVLATCTYMLIIGQLLVKFGARGSVVGWGTIPQAGRSRIRNPMRTLNFQLT